jgi:hypothetical protein
MSNASGNDGARLFGNRKDGREQLSDSTVACLSSPPVMSYSIEIVAAVLGLAALSALVPIARLLSPKFIKSYREALTRARLGEGRDTKAYRPTGT